MTDRDQKIFRRAFFCLQILDERLAEAVGKVFVEVVTDTPVKLWCGSPSTSPEMKVSRAIVVGPGSRAISVLAGQTLHLWAAA